jgi:hypothetical protein
MKHRFYGDKKDYLKYGLIEILATKYRTIGINWYLTDDRHGKQKFGKDIKYLDDEKWESFEPRIYSLLSARVKNNQRNVSFCGFDRVLKIDHEFLELIPDESNSRSAWHSRAKEELHSSDFVFLDPDTGVKDLPRAPIRATEYASGDEISTYDWCDLLVVQFLGRDKRYGQLYANPVTAHAKRLGKNVIAFIASSVAFLYVTNNVDLHLLRQIFEKWDTKIHPQILVVT